MKIFNLVITTENKMGEEILDVLEENLQMVRDHYFSLFTKTLFDLEKLRKDTWNQNLITDIQERLVKGFSSYECEEPRELN